MANSIAQFIINWRAKHPGEFLSLNPLSLLLIITSLCRISVNERLSNEATTHPKSLLVEANRPSVDYFAPLILLPAQLGGEY